VDSASPDPVDRLLTAPNVNHLWAQLLIEECVRQGVTRFFLAPGSRSTPLTTAVARHPQARATMHFDERGGAFAALGYGRATGTPAGWVTTSGTAVANGFPAVVEAATDGVPMLLLTGDRPPELRDTGANQTVDQVKIFGDYVCWETDLPAPSRATEPMLVLTAVAQGVHRARRPPAGPVHLNCMYRKPLAPTSNPDRGPHGTPVDATDQPALADWAAHDAPYTTYPTTASHSDGTDADALIARLRAVDRGLVIAGRLADPGPARAAARALGWPLVPDVTSRLRFGVGDAAAGDVAVPYVDALLQSERFRAAAAPDAVLHLGGRYVSKRLRQFCAAARPDVWAVVRPDPRRLDPDHRATHHVESSVAAFTQALTAGGGGGSEGARDGASPRSQWTERWAAANAAAGTALDTFVEESEALSEPLVARLVTRHRPAEHALVLASSMPVRDAMRYGDVTGAGGPVFANRGASGIDGTLATAAGVAASGTPVTAVVGDLALLHDLNSLALLQGRPVVLVLLNNDGGGIFHFLPIAEAEDVFEPYFATPHGRSFAQAAAAFDLDYHQPDTKDAFVEAYRAACGADGPALIEVTTDRNENRALHDRLDDRLAAAVTVALDEEGAAAGPRSA
jgi:2-succinyl-5-enolpyruvyl-6-hydroxy-3-cyclohexene-1-carboxylate synthase